MSGKHRGMVCVPRGVWDGGSGVACMHVRDALLSCNGSS